MSWMAWTLPTAAFFTAVFLGLIGMTVWELRSPTHARKGMLPMATTRGDRLFVSLLCSAVIHVCWLALSDGSVLIASAVSVAVAFILMRWG